MTVVDTSVWVDHLRHRNRALVDLLNRAEVLSHPFVIGELALGHMRLRAEILALLERLPRAAPASHEEVLALVDRHRLAGSGIGWIDAHLLSSARLSAAKLWTLDRRLSKVASAIGVGTG